MEKPAYWAQNKIFIDGSPQKRLMIVFKTPPCQKALKEGKCSVCGFEVHSFGVKNYNLVSQFNSLQGLIKKNEIEHIDVLSSGSILDRNQIDYNQVLNLMEEIGKLNPLKSVLIEGRSEYCQLDKIKEIKKILGDIKLEYGIGLESWSDAVRNKMLKKNLTLKDYINCLKRLTKIGVGVCTYVLMGPPGLSLEQSLEDAKKSIIKVVNLYIKYQCRGRIALFPVFIAPHTRLENLYNQKKYRLINLSDILTVISDFKRAVDFKKYPLFIGLDDENISRGRYVFARNEKERGILKLIKKFNSTQEL